MAAGARMSSYSVYQNGKFAGLSQNASKEMEVTQELHHKMSKKIAQLTKVIYALNTKKDEHEVYIQNLEQKHKTDMQELLDEAKKRVSVYKCKLNEEVDYKLKIEELEKAVCNYQTQQEDMIQDYEQYKEQVEEMKANLKSDYSQRIWNFSGELLELKKDFESQLGKFSHIHNHFEQEKESLRKELHTQNEDKLKALKNKHDAQKNTWLSEKEKLKKEHVAELEEVKKFSLDAENEMKKLNSDWESKLSKAQKFFEEELAALKRSADLSQEESMKSVLESKKKLVQEFSFKESKLKEQVNGLLLDLSKQEELSKEHKFKFDKLQTDEQDKNNELVGLSKKLEESRMEEAKNTSRLKSMETQLIVAQETIKQLEMKLQKKSNQIIELKAAETHQTETIKELKAEVSKLESRIPLMEDEANTLKKQQAMASKSQMEHLKIMEKALSDSSAEKQLISECLKTELENVKTSSMQQIKEIEWCHQETVNKLKSLHQKELEEQRKQYKKMLHQFTQDAEKSLEEKTKSLTAEKTSVETELERLRKDFRTKLCAAEQEVKRLEGLVKENEENLGSASSHMNSLREALASLKMELNNTKVELRDEKSLNMVQKGELEKLKVMHEKKIKQSKIELNEKLKNVTAELESKWSEKLREKYERLEQKIAEKREEIFQLNKTKDLEKAKAEVDWMNKVKLLTMQVNSMKEETQHQHTEMLQKLEDEKEKARLERSLLEKDKADAIYHLSNKMSAMEESYKEEVKNLKQVHNSSMKDLEAQLNEKYMTDMKAQLCAHQASLESVRAEDAQKYKAERQSLEDMHERSISKMQDELCRRNMEKTESMVLTHKSQLHSVEVELQRALELSCQKDKDHIMHQDELKMEIGHLESQIKYLDQEIIDLKKTICDLNQQKEQKQEEILRIKADTKQQLRKMEELLTEMHQLELKKLETSHTHKIQQMTCDFNEAQVILKERISALNIRLHEADEQYRNREPRLEDLELIHQLRDVLAEREYRIKQLQDEKRYFQMELVNRETNFNKMFNANPNVGVINPLAKKGEKGNSKHASAPVLGGTRLEHLPGSPIHDEQLNRVKPLPPPRTVSSRKFLK